MRIIPAMVESVRRYCAGAGVQVTALLAQDSETKAASDTLPRMLFVFGETNGNVGKFVPIGTHPTNDPLVFGFVEEAWTCLCTAYNSSDINNPELQHDACSVVRDLLLEALQASAYPVDFSSIRQQWVSRSKTFAHGMGIRVTGTVAQPMILTVQAEREVWPWRIDNTTVVDGQDIDTLTNLPSVETDPDQ